MLFNEYDLDELTLQQCVEMYENNETASIINNGKISQLFEEGD